MKIIMKHVSLHSLIVALIAIAISYFTFLGFSKPPLDVLGTWDNIDKWFDGDIFRVIKIETDMFHRAHYRDNVHPFYSLITYPFVYGIGKLLNVDSYSAVSVSHAFWAGLLATLIYFIALREVRNRAIAALLTVFSCTSASFIFWTTVPESFVLGALTISAVILFHGSEKLQSSKAWIGITLIAFSITITNVSVAILSMLLRLTYVRVFRILSISLAIAVGITVIQHAIFPEAGLFFLGLQKEAGYVGLTHKSAPELAFILANRGITFLTSGFVLPGISALPTTNSGVLNILTVRSILQVMPGPFGMTALVSWWILLGCGIYKTILNWHEEGVCKLAVLFLTTQFVLHLAYGENTFLYLLHSLPAVLVLISHALTGKRRRFLVCVVVVGLVTGLISNSGMFFSARDSLTTPLDNPHTPLTIRSQ